MYIIRNAIIQDRWQCHIYSMVYVFNTIHRYPRTSQLLHNIESEREPMLGEHVRLEPETLMLWGASKYTTVQPQFRNSVALFYCAMKTAY